MFITPSFKKSLIVEQFRGNYLKKNSYSDFGVNSQRIISTKDPARVFDNCSEMRTEAILNNVSLLLWTNPLGFGIL